MEKQYTFTGKAPFDKDAYGLNMMQFKAVEMLSGGKYSVADVAEELGVTKQTVYNWKKMDGFKGAIAAVVADEEQRTINFIKSKSYEAAKKYWEECCNAKDSKTREKALATWLDRCLGKPKESLQVEGAITETKEDFDIQAALKELKERSEDLPAEKILPFAQ